MHADDATAGGCRAHLQTRWNHLVNTSDVCRITLCQIVIYCTYDGKEEVNIWYMDPVHVVVDVKVTAD